MVLFTLRLKQQQQQQTCQVVLLLYLSTIWGYYLLIKTMSYCLLRGDLIKVQSILKSSVKPRLRIFSILKYSPGREAVAQRLTGAISEKSRSQSFPKAKDSGLLQKSHPLIPNARVFLPSNFMSGESPQFTVGRISSWNLSLSWPSSGQFSWRVSCCWPPRPLGTTGAQAVRARLLQEEVQTGTAAGSMAASWGDGAGLIHGSFYFKLLLAPSTIRRW